MKTIGITGASGMIGSRVLSHLLEKFPEFRFKCLARSLPQNTHGGDRVEWFQGDLMSEPDCTEFVANLDVLIHLAQANSPASSDRHWPSDLQCNLTSSLNLLQAMRNRGGKACHVIFSSSGGAIYGFNPLDGPDFDEDQPCQPVSPYGIQKLAVENYIRLGVLQGWLSATILRISNAYGVLLPMEKRQGFLGVAVSRLQAGLPLKIFGPLNAIRDYVHLDDICRAVALSTERDQGFEVFNIGLGQGASVREILEILKELTQRDVRIEESAFGAQVFQLMPKVVLSIGKAERDLGWRPLIGLREGIERLWREAESLRPMSDSG